MLLTACYHLCRPYDDPYSFICPPSLSGNSCSINARKARLAWAAAPLSTMIRRETETRHADQRTIMENIASPIQFWQCHWMTASTALHHPNLSRNNFAIWCQWIWLAELISGMSKSRCVSHCENAGISLCNTKRSSADNIVELFAMTTQYTILLEVSRPWIC